VVGNRNVIVGVQGSRDEGVRGEKKRMHDEGSKCQ